MKRRFVPDSEKAIQLRVRRIYATFGCAVYSLSQPRASMQTAGLPDLYVIHPRKGAWWHEVKRPNGRQSPAQKLFAENCFAADVTYVLGGADAAYQQLMQVGLIVTHGRAS